MKVLITGASGSLGSHLVERFASRNHQVTGLTRAADRVSHLLHTGANFVLGDVRVAASLDIQTFEQDCLVHTVAVVGGSHCHRTREATDRQGTLNVLEAAKRAGCRKIIHISSIAVYDLPTTGGRVDEAGPLNSHKTSTSCYQDSKLAIEELVREFAKENSLAVTVLRPSVFVGRYDRHTTPRIIRFLRSPLAGVIGRGNNLVPCVDLDELADLVVNAAERRCAIGRTYNVSARQSVSLGELLATHATEIGRPLKRHYGEGSARFLATLLERSGRLTRQKKEPLLDRFMLDVATMNCTVGCSRAEEDLGWEGTGDLRHAIRQSVDWQEENMG